MKKTLVLTAALAAMAVSVWAAPMGGTEKGDVRLDLNYGFNQEVADIDGDNGIVGGDATIGLGNNWGFQYENYTVDTTYGKVEDHHFRALYKVTPNVGVYAGVSHVNIAHYNDSTGAEIGVTGQIDLSDKAFAWGSIGLGEDVNTYELGVGYQVAPQMDVHLAYHESSYDFKNVDNDVKGWQLGVGYQF